MGPRKNTNNPESTRASLNHELPLITSLALLLTLVLILASGYWSWGRWISDVETQRLLQLTRQQADQRAEDVSRYIRQQQQQLDRFSERASTLAVVRSDDPALRTSVLNSLQTAYPDALAFKLFTPDRREHLNPVVDQPSFTELDMIHRAERREQVPPEALKAGNQRYLHFIGTLIDSETDALLGTLLVTLSADPLFERLRQLEPGLGKTELLRRNSGRPVPIYSTGEGDAGPGRQVPVANSEWLLEFTPSAQLQQQARQSPWLLLTLHLVIGGALLGGVFWLTGRLDPQRRPQPEAVDVTLHGSQRAGPAQGEEDLMNLQVADEDADLLGLQEGRAGHRAGERPAPTSDLALPDEIFRAYDIRGLAGSQVTAELAVLVGQAVASEVLAAGEQSLFVARDGRIHSPELCDALIEGVLSTGCQVVNLGAVPTPLLYFATCELGSSNSGIMVTASHNSAEYNGFKMVVNGHTLADDDIQQIKQRMLQQDFFRGEGSETSHQIVPEYIDRIFSDVALAGEVHIVIDAGNGITGEVAPLLFEELGCQVEPLYCELDGSFPNHDPDPTIEANLQDLIRTVQARQADLGVAFDGDGDRLVLVTPKGRIIWPDRLLMLFAKDIVARNPGADVLFDIKCTRELNPLVSSYGGRPIMWKSGHSHMRAKMQESGALVGGEMSGHIFIKDRWYGFDDGMYAAARLLEIMTLRDQDMDSLFDSFPVLPSTPEIRIAVAESRKFSLITELVASGNFQNGKAITIDGLRVDFARGWGLVRASNTSAALTLRFEAENEEILQQIQQLFKRELLKVEPALIFPF